LLGKKTGRTVKDMAINIEEPTGKTMGFMVSGGHQYWAER